MSAPSKTALSIQNAGPVMTANAPSISLPLRFILAGLAALVAAVILIIAKPQVLSTYHYNQYVIAVTHLVVLGWITSLVMGAVYQLVPVALETPLYSERLAKWQFLFHAIGVAGMVWMFWHWNLKQVGHFGSAFAFGAALFAYNIFRTLVRIPRWNVVAAAVGSTLFWLGLTALAGLLIVAGKCSYESTPSMSSDNPLRALLVATQSAGQFAWRFDPISAMHAHAHAGVVGIFIMLIVGVSYRLIPMFTLSEIQSARRAAASVLLLNIGLLGSFITIALRSAWKPLFVLVILAGLLIYGIEIVAILRARKRRVLDWGVRYFVTGLALLGVLCVVAAILTWPGLQLTAFIGQLENVYGFLALLGVVSLAIIGMLYKIIPFLVWYSVYSRKIGLVKVPNLADLYSTKIQMIGFWSYLTGLGGITAAILCSSSVGVRGGAALLAVAVACLLVNTAKMLAHFVRPEVAPAVPEKANRPGSLTHSTVFA